MGETLNRFGNPKRHHLYSMFESGSYSDFTIGYGDTDFPVHKCILSAGNLYFQSMLNNHWKESNRCEIIPPEATTIDAFRTVLIYLYTGLIEKEILSVHLLELFELATYFQVESLRDLILTELEGMMNLDNATEFLGYYDRHGDDDQLSEIIVRFIALNSYELARRNFPFHLLKADMLTEVFIRQVENDPTRCPIVEDEVVEVNYEGRGRYYRATVLREQEDNMYEVRYVDDGVTGSVDRKLIRSVKDGKSGLKREATDDRIFEVGEKIEADYRQRGHYFPGRIFRDNHNGTYDIHYDDGEEERYVRTQAIRRQARR